MNLFVKLAQLREYNGYNFKFYIYNHFVLKNTSQTAQSAKIVAFLLNGEYAY
jgi:hypothetical protein